MNPKANLQIGLSSLLDTKNLRSTALGVCIRFKAAESYRFGIGGSVDVAAACKVSGLKGTSLGFKENKCTIKLHN